MLTRLSLGTTVRSIMAECRFNSKTARDRLVALSTTDDILRDELLRRGADQAIRDFHSAGRRATVEETEPELYTPRAVEQTAQLEQRRQEKIERRLFWDRYALFGHMPLKSAKVMDLRDSALARRKQAAGNIRCADFEDDLMKKLKGQDKNVGQFFTSNKIIEIAKAHNVIF